VRFQARLRVGLLFVAATLAVQPAAGREKAPGADEQLPPTNALFGKIVSIEQACSAFVVQLEDNKKTQAKLIVSPERSHWSPEPQGCSFLSIAGKKMVLKPGSWVSVHYLTLEIGNIVTWVVVRRDKATPACKGQGGADPTPETIFSAGCDGVSQPDCVSCDGPQYPRIAPKGIAGSVWVNVVIAPDGRVSGVWLLRGLQNDLDQTTIAAVRLWRFKPIVGADGKAVWAATPVEVIFRSAAHAPIRANSD
jgi:TonB family protein